LALTFQIEPATSGDFSAIESLLLAASLTTDGLRDQFPDAYVVARLGDVVIGAAGLERYGASALLRSVVVVSEQRGHGIARSLVEERLAAARQAEVTRVFLLTTTADSYFGGLGFQQTPRDSAPVALAASPEFARACPASATCLSRAP